MWKEFAFNKMVSRPSQRWPTYRRPRISIISAASSSLQSFDGEVEKVCFLWETLKGDWNDPTFIIWKSQTWLRSIPRPLANRKNSKNLNHFKRLITRFHWLRRSSSLPIYIIRFFSSLNLCGSYTKAHWIAAFNFRRVFQKNWIFLGWYLGSCLSAGN